MPILNLQERKADWCLDRELLSQPGHGAHVSHQIHDPLRRAHRSRLYRKEVDEKSAQWSHMLPGVTKEGCDQWEVLEGG